jgi:ParB family transcriptional regulator, chromosome partitioning protein
MTGKGLESLIPKKNRPENDPVKTPPGVSRVPGPAVPSIMPVTARVRPTDYVRSERERGVPEPRKQHSESIFQIEVDKIKSNPYQPRRHFNDEDLQGLAQSIREFGIIQPIVVSKVTKETDHGTAVEYQLIAGERRLMAARLIGLERVPAIVKQIDEHRTKLELALIENIQRSDLNPIDEARGYARLQEEFGLMQREVAVRVGKSREVVANCLRLLNLPTDIQEAVAAGKVSESQARSLLAISDPGEQRRVFQSLLSEKLSVRAIQERAKTPPRMPDPELKHWERRLEERLGVPARVIKEGSRGKLVIQFYSEDEWRGVLEKLLGSEEEI